MIRKSYGTLKAFDGAPVSSLLPVGAERHLDGRAKSAVCHPLRSVFFVGSFPVQEHGSRGISEDLCARLAVAGWQIGIVSRHSSRIGRVLEMLWTCWRQRRRYRVAAVDVYSGAAFFWAKAVCGLLRRIDKPYILMLHGGNLPKFSASRQEMVRRLLASAVAVTTPSHYLMEQMQPYRNDIQILPNGISVSAYPYELRQPGSLRLIWLRAFHEIYNPRMAVQVLALLKREFPDICLTMIGPDKGDGSLQATRQEAERLCVIESLTLSGSVRKEEVPGKFACNDIFLNTARIDNTPVTVLEAMASGLCVVSTSVGGIPYLVQDESDGLLVPSENAESMAAAVRRIIVEPGLSRRLSRNARRKVELLDWSVIVPRWEELLGCASQLRG
jgi:glycosyltransferase involved in cell wall biosynthesis